MSRAAYMREYRAKQWDCPNCGQRVSSMIRPPSVNVTVKATEGPAFAQFRPVPKPGK